jgi:CHAD domain-containing protein
VRSAPGTAGPVSPELVLVSPELAAIVAGTPDALIVGDSEPVDEETEDLASHGGTPGGSVRYDTSDLVLERHGLTLELENRDDLQVWRLTLPRGETVELPAGPSGVPRRIAGLLDTLLGDDDLRRVPKRSSSPEIERLEAQLIAQRHSLIAHDAGARLAVDPENLHQLRVASRRARAFLRVARELVDGEWAAQLNGALRRLGQASNQARDLDVLLEHLEHEAPTLGTPDSEAATQLIRMLERDRETVQAELEETLDSSAHRALLEQLALPVEVAEQPTDRTLADLAARELRRLLTQVRALGKSPADEKLHDLRIRVKRVRYAAELAGVRGGKRTAHLIGAATALQDILGAHQDAVVAEQRIRALAERSEDSRVAFAAGRLAERQRQRRDALQRQLPDAWRRLRKLVH